jgi:hypothetical protein
MKQPYCTEKYCNTRASFNYKGEITGLYCVRHKKSDMINVLFNRCMYEKCRKKAMGNITNCEMDKINERGIYCQVHSIERDTVLLDTIEPETKTELDTGYTADTCNLLSSPPKKHNKLLQLYYISRYYNWLHIIFTV